MPKLSDLVSRSSEVTGVHIATVREISRRLREAELIRTGMGGRYGGADMMPRDAANLLTALLIVRASSVSLADIVPLTRSHLNFRAYIHEDHRLLLGRWDQVLFLPQLKRLKRGHTFGDAFSALIASVASGDLPRATEDWVSFRSRGITPSFALDVVVTSPKPHPEARIEFAAPVFDQVSLIYVQPRDARKIIIPDAPRKWSDLPEATSFDLTVRASITENTLWSIGHLLRHSWIEHA
jgi:hypothetical protein